MGTLTPLPGSLLYLDTCCIIYSVEQIDPYTTLLLPFWQGASAGAYLLVTSALSLLETLVGPIRSGDSTLEAGYRRLLQRSTDLRMAAVTTSVLERAAGLRATTGLKTPDAIHAATALVEGCTYFITNDAAFRRVPSLAVTVLSELIVPEQGS